jgi:hypothetical protein
MIKHSVSLDYTNKQIMATLPLRGKEEEFLSPNQDRATCKKLKGKPNDIKNLQKSVGKLFDRGHIKFVKNLPEDIQSKFINKPVQHWIPWRTVHNPKSKSTPVRVVMDASSKTPTRPDGRVESLNLVKLVLKFIMGRHAVTGDFSQFDNSLKLKEE